MLMVFFAITEEEREKRDIQLEAALKSMAQGEVGAMESFYELSKSQVYGFALSILKNAHDAQDVMHDTYIKAFRAAAAYTPKGTPMAWLLTIVRNLALMKIRGRKRTADSGEEAIQLFVADSKIPAAEDKVVLEAAISELKDDERQIVMLHAVAGFKHREIASVLEMSVNTVLSKYNRALKKLRAKLEVSE